MFVKSLRAAGLAAILAMGGTATAGAAVIQADIRTELGFFSSSVRVFEVTGASVGAGAELDLSHEISNDGGYTGAVLVDIDPTNGTVTVTGTDPFFDFPESGINSADFEYVNVFITNIVFDGPDGISSLAALSDELLNDVYGEGYTLDLDFTENSISLTWYNEAFSIYVEDGSSSVFDFSTGEQSIPVPAPLSIALLGVGLIGLAASRRRSIA